MARNSAVSRKQKPFNWATRVGGSAVGVFCGLAGLQHGVGEILQGNKATPAIMISAWDPPSALFGDEPAYTVVPNFLLTGILAFTVSLLIVIWAIAFIQRRNGAVVFIILSITSFLVGGGIVPLYPAIIAGIAATKINSPLTWWRAHLPARVGSFLAKSWLFCMIAFAILFPPMLFSGYFFGDNIDLIWAVGYLAFALIIFSVPAELAYDIRDRTSR